MFPDDIYTTPFSMFHWFTAIPLSPPLKETKWSRASEGAADKKELAQSQTEV